MNILDTSREITTCRDAYLSEDYITLYIQYDRNLIDELKDIRLRMCLSDKPFNLHSFCTY